jgi:hypothetical protein
LFVKGKFSFNLATKLRKIIKQTKNEGDETDPSQDENSGLGELREIDSPER